MDKSVAGLRSPAFDMVVERGKIREFARATMSRNPDYLDDPAAVSPPTYLVTSGFWAPPEAEKIFGALKIDLGRLLHGGMEFVFHGPPPCAGTNLTVEGRVDKVYEKEGRRGGTMTFAEMVYEFRDEQGTLVAESRSTLIETAKAPTQEG